MNIAERNVCYMILTRQFNRNSGHKQSLRGCVSDEVGACDSVHPAGFNYFAISIYLGVPYLADVFGERPSDKCPLLGECPLRVSLTWCPLLGQCVR